MCTKELGRYGVVVVVGWGLRVGPAGAAAEIRGARLSLPNRRLKPQTFDRRYVNLEGGLGCKEGGVLPL